MPRKSLIVMMVIWLLPALARSEPLLVAVAANFLDTLRDVEAAFEAATGHQVTTVAGSTGKLYAQIVNGAPYDVFLAADPERPARLEAEGLCVSGSRVTYALGAIALWSPEADLVDEQGAILRDGDFRHLAIANPQLAPYGQAARQVLEKLGLWETLQGRIVRGENIAQTFQFVVSGNARLGFVALSQLDAARGGSRWLIPGDFYTPIRQDAVILKDSAVARAFLAFLAGDAASELIRNRGYAVPQEVKEFDDQ
jgi:molybdate transport system substrate-binding protein